jgi:prevent-host-death family protein
MVAVDGRDEQTWEARIGMRGTRRLTPDRLLSNLSGTTSGVIMKKAPNAGHEPIRETSHVPASQVKNAWHEYVERVSQGREEIIVTRYGRPIMKLTPIDSSERPGFLGYLTDTVTVHGDIEGPTGEVWEAEADG